jgi:hypothetical protein
MRKKKENEREDSTTQNRNKMPANELIKGSMTMKKNYKGKR